MQKRELNRKGVEKIMTKAIIGVVAGVVVIAAVAGIAVKKKKK